jgi:hypothetical protein
MTHRRKKYEGKQFGMTNPKHFVSEIFTRLSNPLSTTRRHISFQDAKQPCLIIALLEKIVGNLLLMIKKTLPDFLLNNMLKVSN